MPAVFRSAVNWMALLGALCAAGCASHPPRQVVISLDPSLRQAPGTFTVDVVAVNEADYARFAGISVDDFWKPSDPLRSTFPRFEAALTRENTSATLAATDPLWARWDAAGAKYLVAIALIPGLRGSGEGEKDPRRLILPLQRQRWNSLDPIQVVVSKAGLMTTTPPKPR